MKRISIFLALLFLSVPSFAADTGSCLVKGVTTRIDSVISLGAIREHTAYVMSCPQGQFLFHVVGKNSVDQLENAKANNRRVSINYDDNIFEIVPAFNNQKVYQAFGVDSF
jgi:hypothetical protein